MGMRFLGSVCRVRTSRAGVGSVTGFSEPDVMHIPTRRYPSVQRRPIPLSRPLDMPTRPRRVGMSCALDLLR
jgi:hypothetical protein